MSEVDDRRMTLVEHLTDLRQAILVMLAAFLTGSLIGYLLAPSLFAMIKSLLPDIDIVYFGPFDALFLHIRLAVVLGLILSLPVLIASITWFVAPGLYANEKSVLFFLGIAAMGLFAAGAAYAAFIVLPALLRFLLTYSTPEMMPFISGEEYLTFILSFLVYCGITFETPLLIFVLIRYRLLSPATVAGQRKLLLGILTGMALFFSPGGDLFTQVMLVAPVYLLFELSVFAAGRFAASLFPAGGDDVVWKPRD